jgi:hypothetical protein
MAATNASSSCGGVTSPSVMSVLFPYVYPVPRQTSVFVDATAAGLRIAIDVHGDKPWVGFRSRLLDAMARYPHRNASGRGTGVPGRRHHLVDRRGRGRVAPLA